MSVIEKNNILDDISEVGFEEIKFKDLKVGDNILFTFHNGLVVGDGTVVRNAVVREVNGYVIVETNKSEGVGVMLMPGCPIRAERYYRRR